MGWRLCDEFIDVFEGLDDVAWKQLYEVDNLILCFRGANALPCYLNRL